MSRLENISTLKTKITNLQQESDRAQGALDAVLAKVKEEFGCGSLEEGEKHLRALERTMRHKEKVIQKALDEFVEKWGHVLE